MPNRTSHDESKGKIIDKHTKGGSEIDLTKVNALPTKHFVLNIVLPIIKACNKCHMSFKVISRTAKYCPYCRPGIRHKQSEKRNARAKKRKETKK